MAQITIYLDKETEEKLRTLVQAKHISQSKWIASIIREKLETEWPESIVQLAGAWQDFPDIEEIRAGLSQDAVRESL
jgi:hypothetical protein